MRRRANEIGTHSNPAEKRAVESEGAAEGGCGGNFAAPERLSPAACSVRSRSQQKSFLFLLEEKIGRAQIKKCKENFFAGWRALASGGGANQPFCSHLRLSASVGQAKKVRAKCKISPPLLWLICILWRRQSGIWEIFH